MFLEIFFVIYIKQKTFMSQTCEAMLNFNLAGLRKPVRQIIRKLEGLRLQQLLLQKVFPKILKIKKQQQQQQHNSGNKSCVQQVAKRNAGTVGSTWSRGSVHCEVSELPPIWYVASANPKFSTTYNLQRLNQSLVSVVLQSNLKLIKQLSSAR